MCKESEKSTIIKYTFDSLGKNKQKHQSNNGKNNQQIHR